MLGAFVLTTILFKAIGKWSSLYFLWGCLHCLTLFTTSLLLCQEATGQLTHQNYSFKQTLVQQQSRGKKLSLTSMIVISGHTVVDSAIIFCKTSSTSASFFPGSTGKQTQKLTNGCQEWQIWTSRLLKMELRLSLRLQVKGSSGRAMQWYPCCSLSAVQISYVGHHLCHFVGQRQS